MRLTIDKILSYGPCDGWPRERMLAVTGGREEFDTSELVNMDIPTPDLVWLTGAILSARGNRDEYLLKAAFAARVLPLYERQYPGDMRPRQSISAARLYALGEIEAESLAATAYSADTAAAYASYAATTATAAATAATAACGAASASADAYYAAAYASYAADAAAAAYASYAADAAAAAAAVAKIAERAAQREICAVFLRNLEG